MKRRVHEEDEVGELNIVPYLDIVVNLVMFMLLSMAGLITLGVLTVDTPRIGGADAGLTQPEGGPKLLLTVGITNRGFYIAGQGGVLEGVPDAAAGLDKTRPPTIPLKNGQYDYVGLTRLLADIKTKFPNDKSVILVAEMDTPYDVLIHVMDATREQIISYEGKVERKVLFPQVSLSSMVQ
jgi:biopolymer transport protein ExbD